MNFQETFNRDIQTAFESFHQKNPIVYKLYKKQIVRAIKAHKQKISSKLIINYIRWEIYINTADSSFYIDNNGEEQPLRINDAYTSRYARLFASDYPQHKHLLNFRELRS